LNVFGNKKSQAQKEVSAEGSKYWQGEWVCKDCGYIYNRVSTAAGDGVAAARLKCDNNNRIVNLFAPDANNKHIVSSFLSFPLAARMCWFVF
jgi:hypothetical protein